MGFVKAIGRAVKRFVVGLLLVIGWALKAVFWALAVGIVVGIGYGIYEEVTDKQETAASPAIRTAAQTSDDSVPEPPVRRVDLEMSDVSYLDCDFSDTAARVLGAVWQVRTPSGTGTAFHIGDGRWLTAEHVVSGHKQATLTYQGRLSVASVEAAHSDLDLALLSSDASPERLAFGRLDELGPGNHAYAIGFPFYEADEAAVSRGIVSRIFDTADGPIIQTDTSVNLGTAAGLW